MKINLSNHLLIGFQRQWQIMQFVKRRNLLKLFVEDCHRQGNRVVGITSEEARQFLPVDDRFGFLLDRYAEDLEAENKYRVTKRDRNMFVVSPTAEHTDNLFPVYVVRSQVVHALGPTGSMEDPSKVLIFGGDYLPSGMSLEDTFTSAFDGQGLVIADNPAQDGVDSLRARQFLKYKDKYHSMVGFDAQKSRKENEMAQALAERAGKNWIAIGNQHSPSRCRTCIEVDLPESAFESSYSLTTALKEAILTPSYSNVCSYESRFTKAKWGFAFAIGTLRNMHERFTE